MVDNARPFDPLRIQFTAGGKSIAAITDKNGGARLDKAQLEPELISSVTGRERATRRVIGFNDVPNDLRNAIVVTEDRSFFEHHGVNIRGIIRALLRRYDSDPNSPLARQGGSSITQQLVKNLLLSPEYSLKRKISEAYMSIILETRLSKEDIFALYCNQVYLGQQSGFSINGFGEASSAYFNKDVTTLTLPESAFLAGLIRSPNRYNPYHDLGTARARRDQVLESMTETSAITPDQARQAESVDLTLAPAKGRIDISDAPYFADYAQNQLGDVITGQGADHLRIYTSVDMDLQRAAYAAVTKQLALLDKIEKKRFPEGTVQAALVAMNLAGKAGLPRVAPAYPAMALGTAEATPLQVASAYTAFAANGTRTTPIAIDRVTTGNGTTIAKPMAQKNEVLRPEIAYVMTSFMKDVVNRGTGAPIRARGFKFNVAGKTGTSRDAWFAGFTPNLVCVVWVGFDDGSQLGLTGAASALPIWSDFMSVALTNHPEWTGDWQMPEGVKQQDIDPATGQIAKADTVNKRSELFINGSIPGSATADATDETAQQPPTVSAGQETNKDPNIEPAALPESTPAEPRAKPTPKTDLRSKPDARDLFDAGSSTKLLVTITLDIDTT